MSKPINIVGEKYHYLTVLRKIIKKHGTAWICKCKCGNITTVNNCHLRSKTKPTRSCGCLLKEVNSKPRKHGYCHRSKTLPPEYHSWAGMKKRCYNSKNNRYKYYGGRGIAICGMLRDFRGFLKELGKRTSITYSLDRIDNNSHYSCGNCPECIKNNWTRNVRWASPIEQMNNQSKTIFITFKNHTKSLSDWARILNINRMTLWSRIFRYSWSIQEAFSIPVKNLETNLNKYLKLIT